MIVVVGVEDVNNYKGVDCYNEQGKGCIFVDFVYNGGYVEIF